MTSILLADGLETEIERESSEIRGFMVRAVTNADVLADPTGWPVAVAFARGKERPVTFHAATWVAGTFESRLGTAYQCEVEVGGPGTGASAQLSPGRHKVFVRVTAALEGPVVIPAGFLTVR